MKAADSEFFEAYKRLEKLCSEMFSCQSGVSEYITQMETIPDRERMFVPSFAADYRTLKHLRYVRNKIAHESDSAAFSTEEDLRQVRDFYRRIMKGDDPLAVHEKQKRAAKRPKKNNTAAASKKKAVAQKKNNRAAVGLWIAAVLLLLGILWYLGSS